MSDYKTRTGKLLILLLAYCREKGVLADREFFYCSIVFILVYWFNLILKLTCRCTCENCQILDRVEECVCCSEIDRIVAKNQEAIEFEGLIEPPHCITQHPGFHAVCFNRWVLQTAWFQYKQQYNEHYQGPEHKKNRHI